MAEASGGGYRTRERWLSLADDRGPMQEGVVERVKSYGFNRRHRPSSCSRVLYLMRNSPPLPLWSMLTVRPSTSCSAFSSARVSGPSPPWRAWPPWLRPFGVHCRLGDLLDLTHAQALVENALGHLDRILHGDSSARHGRR